ncbi:hypothetical protein [Deinococcus koreensis]|uniref:DUF11 domain-containing protein n=1 Tax=Deinococcus koreensis TaxID=2054903 RepID=A0A2K3USN2_9DEIO|nr:hypothetical protein [Deinococcus koreensis]PNY79552.1 hypothetical protein CVO96_19190 [Deinococcus koreensis]
MNRPFATLALIAALAAGSASAVGTVAGTPISNIATATFQDDNGASQPETKSNNGIPVTTTVQAVPSFSITPNSTGTPLTAGFSPGQTLQVVPGQTNVAFKYTLTNTGNVPNESYSLARQTFNSGSSGLTNIRYVLDSNGDGIFNPATDTVITNDKITGVAPDQVKTFFVVYDIPSTAFNGQKAGISPIGNRDANSTYDGTGASAPSDSDNYHQATVVRTDAGNLGPLNDADGNGQVDGSATATAPYTVSAGATTYNLVTPSGDSQSAIAPASTAQQYVYFSNTVRNIGNRSDTFSLSVPDTSALDAAGFPADSRADLFVVDNGGALVSTSSTTPLNADPDGTGPGLGGAYTFIVRVTLPANAAPDQTATFPVVTVTAKSGNDPAQSDTTSNFVKIQSGVFGNATPGTPGAPAADPSLNPTKPGNPGDTVRIPMDLYNSGNVSDSYTLAGTVTFTDANNQAVPATITYYADANGDGVPDNTTAVVNPVVAAGQELKLVGLVTVPTSAVTGTASISQTARLKDVSNTSTTVITYTDANDTVQVGLIGGVVLSKYVDNTGKDDIPTPPKTYPAEPVYGTNVSTYNPNTEARPSDVLRYVVYGRNNRNSVIKNFVLSDTIPTHTGFWSVAATYNSYGSTFPGASMGAKILYRVGTTGSWMDTAPTDRTLPAGTAIQVGYDWNNDGAITTSDLLPAGAELKLVFKVQVK